MPVFFPEWGSDRREVSEEDIDAEGVEFEFESPPSQEDIQAILGMAAGIKAGQVSMVDIQDSGEWR